MEGIPKKLEGILKHVNVFNGDLIPEPADGPMICSSSIKLSQEESLTQFRTLLPCYVICIVYSSHPTPNSVKHPGPSTTCVTTLQLARFINRPKVNLDTRQSQGAPGSMKPELNP